MPILPRLSVRPCRRGVILALAALAVLVALLSSQRARQQEQQTAALQDRAVTVIIDPGHGGEDGGASSAAGARESELNLAISLRLRTVLRLWGIEPVMVRVTDTAVYSPEAQSLSEKKVSDLHNRVALVNQTPNALLVSIHQNHFTQSQYIGAQVFYAADPASQALAERLQELLRLSLDPDNRRAAKAAPGTVYLMNHIDAPGILVECGFLSNADEALKLQTPTYQTKLAATIAAAVTMYLEEHNEV